MAIQQLTQPIINPISAFDSTRAHTISFVVIGGAQVIGNRLVISDNQTGKEVYNKIQSTMKLEHLIPANTLTNGGYYNAVVYTIDSGNNESVASTPVPFYCYSQPNLTIDNIPVSETIENGTYKFIGSYLQQENELLNSYQYTLYDSNSDVLSQSPLIYYNTDSSLSYTFVGMSNDTSYYIELSGETVNGTKITSGLKYFTVRYIQPASFAICDLVNNCENGYIQISSNVVAIDGKSNPTPPIYIDDKEVDLRDPDSWVEWNSGFRIQDDFTMRVWGRDFNDYQNIITLTNDINTSATPNKIELKWMVGDVIKTLPNYTTVEGENINILNAEVAKIENLSIGGNSEQEKKDMIDFGIDKFLTINTEETLPLSVTIFGNQEQKIQAESYKEQEGENIYITDVDSSQPADIIIKGNNYQATREGYNLLDFNVTQDGRVTVNEDGTITINGTGGFSIKFREFEFKKGATYKTKATLVSGTYTSSDPNHIGIMTPYGNNVWLANDIFNTYTFLEDKVRSGMWVGENCVFNNATFKIYSYEGTEDKEFEQYRASPSPDYPSPIRTVGDNINLFNYNDKKNVNSSYSTDEEGWITLDYNSVATSSIFFNYFTNNLTFKEGKEYSLFLEIKNVTGTGYIYVCSADANSQMANAWVTNFSAMTDGGVYKKNVTTKNNFSQSIYGLRTYCTFNAGDHGSITFRISVLENTDIGVDNFVYSNYNQGSVEVKISNNDNSQSQSIIMPIQQEMLEGDYIKDVEHHEWKKLIITGEENIIYYDAPSTEVANNLNTAYFTVGISKKAQGNSNNIISNMFKNLYTASSIWGNASSTSERLKESIAVDTSIRLRINKNRLQGYDNSQTSNEKVALLKTYLKSLYDAGTPVIVYYKLAEPINLELTEEQREEDNNLNNLNSYSPQTNIYSKDNLTLINAKFLGLPSPYNFSKIYALGDIKNLIDVPNFNIKYEQQYFQSTNTNFILKPNFIYTLSFDYNVNTTSTDLYYSIGYGKNEYDMDLKPNIQYVSLTKGRNSVSFIVPEDVPADSLLWVRFVQTIILADVNVDISNVQLEIGNISTNYENPNLYNIYPTSVGKNLFDYNSPLYLLKNNAVYTPIQNGYNIKPVIENQDSYIGIGIKNILNQGDTYTISFSQLGQFEKFSLYTTEKGNENIISEISIKNNTFVAPDGIYDLQLVFEVDSSNTSNYIEIWNIQIEANNIISEYELHTSNSSVLTLDSQLNAVEEYRDLVCLESPNLLNPETQSGIVEGNMTYYLNQKGNTQYYIWYYNEDGNLITFIDEEGHESSGTTGIKGNFTTHKDCVKITITKTSNAENHDVTKGELMDNRVSITKSDNIQIYYPFITEPSLIKQIGVKELDGTEKWNKLGKVQQGYLYYVDNIIDAYTDNDNVYGIGLSTHFMWDYDGNIYPGVKCQANNGKRLYIGLNKDLSLSDFTEYIKYQYNKNTPIYIYYVLSTPEVIPLSEENKNALTALSTYKPISNIFTNNEIFGYLNLDYVSDYTEQQTQNAYVLLKCWNANAMPYICHSNYIDIPNEKDKVFIWMRRKNNLFDLKIENLGDYNEDDKPKDKTKPIVTLEIDPNNVEATRIPVIAYSIDDNGLKTVRFSKDNGSTWDEIITVDGLSSTNSYTFVNLNPNTTYTIRAEAIDLAGNIGGISQQVTTKSS